MFNPSTQRKQIFDLATGNFIKEARDVLLAGPPASEKAIWPRHSGTQIHDLPAGLINRNKHSANDSRHLQSARDSSLVTERVKKLLLCLAIGKSHARFNHTISVHHVRTGERRRRSVREGHASRRALHARTRLR